LIGGIEMYLSLQGKMHTVEFKSKVQEAESAREVGE
jgi:hypothetical protein